MALLGHKQKRCLAYNVALLKFYHDMLMFELCVSWTVSRLTWSTTVNLSPSERSKICVSPIDLMKKYEQKYKKHMETHETCISSRHFSSLDLSLVHLLSTSINPSSTSTPSHHQLRFFFFRRHSARHQL